MVPSLWPGDLVLVRTCSFSEVSRGAVIVFRQNERLIVHRVMDLKNGRLIARGDARARVDDPVGSENLIGVVEAAFRDGNPIRLCQSRTQRLTAFVLRRSEICTRLFLRCAPFLHRFVLPRYLISQ
jgi:signal peptidase I